MSRKSIDAILSEHREAQQILAELDALLGNTDLEDFQATRKDAMLIATKTVRELAVEMPNATRVFEKLGIDYCCGGQKSLEEACAAANLSIDEVARSLEMSGGNESIDDQRDWAGAPIAELVDHIVNKHHTYVKSETPRLQALLTKVVGVHGTNHPELLQVEAAFSELAAELASHLMKEEQILFPYLKHTSSGNKCGPSCFGSVQNPIRVMMMEHDGAGEKLREIRQATNNYALPQDACFSYGTLFNALQEFEKDLHQHIHLENNILFPRAVAMES
jgi:regulator of cell morphogenesis and NO signaling